MEATQAKVVQFPQAVQYAIPGTPETILKALIRHLSPVWQKMHHPTNPCGVNIDLIMGEERSELHEVSSKAYRDLYYALEKLPNGEELIGLFMEYVCALDEYETHWASREYIKGIMDGAFNFRDVGEALLSGMANE